MTTINSSFQYKHIIRRSSFASVIANLLLVYLLTLSFVTPIYKFSEVYFDLPKINFSVIRAGIGILCIVFFFLYLITASNTTNYLSKVIAVLIPTIICIILVMIIIVMSYFLGVLNYAPEALEYYLLRIDTCFIGYPMMFICGFFFDYVEVKRIRKIFFYAWFIFSFFLLFNINLLIDAYFIYENRPEKTMNYIFLSQEYATITLLAFTFPHSKYRKLFIFLIAIIIFFLVPSRSIALGFISSILIVVFILNKDFVKNISILFTIIAISIFVYNSYLSNNILFENSRLFTTNLSEDVSLEVRLYQAKKNQENLMDTWITGDFMGDIKIHGEDGNETHSYVSFLEQFGIVPFLLLLWSVGILIYYLSRLKNDTSHIYSSILICSFYILPLIAFAKGFNNNFIWFLISRVVVYFYSKKKYFAELGDFSLSSDKPYPSEMS